MPTIDVVIPADGFVILPSRWTEQFLRFRQRHAILQCTRLDENLPDHSITLHVWREPNRHSRSILLRGRIVRFLFQNFGERRQLAEIRVQLFSSRSRRLGDLFLLLKMNLAAADCSVPDSCDALVRKRFLEVSIVRVVVPHRVVSCLTPFPRSRSQ
jgi:hypothetical protein